MSTATVPLSVSTGSNSALDRSMPLHMALALYSAITALILFASLRAADHHFVYALDDPYIEMAMAKSLALHGTWGITRFGFTSSSSSPLFTLLLALLYRLTGVHEVTALFLSWIGGVVSIWLADRLLPGDMNRVLRTATLIAFILATPLFSIAVLGMEHSFHLALALIFLIEFQKSRRSSIRLFFISALMTGARYESLFLIVAAACLLMIQRAWRPLCCMIGGAALAVGSYGAFALAHGSHFLPDSVALKGTTTRGGEFLVVAIVKFLRAPHLALLLLVLLMAAVALRRIQPYWAQLSLLLFLAGTCHVIFASIGAAFRYEAYFIALSCLVLGTAVSYLRDFGTVQKWSLVVALLVSGSVLAVRSSNALRALPGYSRSIYLQQYQSARFLQSFFPEASVAANDIGAISFFTDIHCTDLVGLADGKIFEAKRSGIFTTDFLRSEAAANRVQIAIVYEGWFTGPSGHFWIGPRLPREWTRVAVLKVPHSEMLGGDAVSFYAVDRSMIAPLRASLYRFELTLPAASSLTLQR